MTETDTEVASGAWGLQPEVIHRIREVFSRFPGVDQVVLYGSRAKGNFRPGSDIDLTMLGDTLTWTDLQLIELALDDLCLPYKFDLSLLSHIDHEDLRSHIKRVGEVFYRRGSNGHT